MPAGFRHVLPFLEAYLTCCTLGAKTDSARSCNQNLATDYALCSQQACARVSFIVNVSDTIRNALPRMSRGETDVARRILSDLGRVASGSVRDIAAWCETSDTTVIRFCRAAGFDGYQDLKYHTLRELTNTNQNQILADAANHVDYADDLVASLTSAEPGLDRAAQLLRRASHIALVGVGSSYGVVLILTDILFTMGKQVLPLTNDQSQNYALTPPADGVVLLAISHSGETQDALRAVELARSSGIPTIGISNEPSSELGRGVDVLLATEVVDRSMGSYAISPRICQLAILDTLLARVGRPDHHVDVPA